MVQALGYRRTLFTSKQLLDLTTFERRFEKISIGLPAKKQAREEGAGDSRPDGGWEE